MKQFLSFKKRSSGSKSLHFLVFIMAASAAVGLLMYGGVLWESFFYEVKIYKRESLFMMPLIISGILTSLAILTGGVILRKISNPLLLNLKESEERYALAMKGANDGLWDRNLETGEVYYSHRWKEMLGYDDEEISNRHEEWQKRVHPDDYRRIMAETKDYLEGRTPCYSSEYRMRHRDGSYRWILARGASGSNKNGKPTRFAGSHTDITERREQEEALRDYSYFLQVLIETIPGPVFYKDAKGKYLGCNEAFEDLFGIKRDSIIGKTVYDIASSELADRCRSMDNRTTSETGIQVYDVSLENRHGKRLDLIFNTAPFRKIDGAIGGVVGIIVDITERRKLESELIDTIRVVEDSYKVWKSTFDTIPDSIVIYDTEFRIIKANAAYHESAGLMLREMIGLPYYEVYPKLDGPLEISSRIMEKGEEMKEGEVFIESLDRTFKIRVYPRYDEVERELQFVQIMEDITEMKRTQNMLLQSAKLASVGEVSAGLAHELNNPMTTILGYTSLILDDMEEGCENHREMKVIERESLRIREIIRNILDFSRQRNISKEETDINEVVRDSMALVRHMATVSDVNVDLDLADELQYPQIDPNQMKQVFINIITNAFHSMGRGGRLLITSEWLGREEAVPLLEGREVREADAYIALKFKDNGCGISPASLERIFEPFFSSKGEDGNGLGLSISYGIVKKHGGEILVNSIPGEGTEFSIILPLESGSEKEQVGEDSADNQLESIVA